MGATKLGKLKRPLIVDYHDYRVFLNEWFPYLEQQHATFSLRSLARDSKVGVSTLSMILSGQRGLSKGTLDKIKPFLFLQERELKYLEVLRGMSEAPTAIVRSQEVSRLQRSKDYRRRHPKEFETYNYLSRWYYVAIREMATLPGFKTKAEWIQPRLREFLPLSDIQQALDFLLKHGFLSEDQANAEPKLLSCMGGVFKLALGTFHRQMLNQVIESIDRTPADERHILGHTMAIPVARAEEAKLILADALKKLEALGEQPGSPDAVYHVELALIPLTQKPKGEKSE